MTQDDPEVPQLLAELTMELRRLNREVEPEGGPRLPTREELSRLTSEVAIPALILFLETQIRALELLRRAIRIADGRATGTAGAGATEVRDRAEKLGQVTLTQVEMVLDELQSAVEARPDDQRAQNLIGEARKIQGQIRDELDADPDPEAAVDIDVESELRSLKDNLDEGDGTGDTLDGTEGGGPGDSSTGGDGGVTGNSSDGDEDEEGNGPD